MSELAHFREGMARLTAAVNLITTDGPDGRHGMVASAVCSVSDDPPTLLVCINRSSRTNALVRDSGLLCVNVLAHDQRAVADAFCRPGTAAERFADDAQWQRLATGAPALVEALASFDCRVAQVVESGTHTIFFGQVEAMRLGAPRAALAYFGRGFHVLG